MAASREVSNLILQVDASVAVAQRNVRALANSVAQDSDNINKSLAKVEQANTRVGQSFGQAAQRSRLLGYQISDIGTQLAGGQSPFLILAQQGPQLANALDGASGAVGRFATFLSGPWGAALLTAGTLLGALAFKHKDAAVTVDDLVKKMREQAAQAANNRTADDAWKQSIDGVTESIRKRTEEQLKALTTEAATEQASLRNARGEVQIAQDNRTKVLAELAAAKKELAAAQAQSQGSIGSPSYAGGANNSGVDQAQIKIRALQAQLATLNGAIARGANDIRGAEATIAERTASYATDASKRINDYYDNQVLKAKLAARSSDALTASLTTQLTKINQLRDAALKATQAEKSGGNQQIGREIDLGQARSIVAGIGGRVTSGYRSQAEQQRLYDTVRTPQNPVALPGTSAHEKGNALDVAFGTGITVASLKKAFADEGVRLTKVLKETGHYHIEFATPAADKSSRSAAASQKAAITNTNAFVQDSDRADKDLLAAQKALVNDTTERARIAADQVRAEQARANDAIKGEVAEGKLTVAQAELLTGKQAQIAAQRIANIEIQKSEEIRRNQLDLTQTDQETQIQHLQAMSDLAVTTKERKDIQLEILSAQTQILINAQQEIIDSKTASQAQKDIAQKLIDRARLGQQDQTKLINRGNQSPGQSYLQSLKDADARMGEDFESIGAKGLDSLNNGLVDAITGAKSLGAVFHDVSKQIIADLLQIAIRKAVIEPLANSLFGGGSGGSSGGLGSLFSSIAGAFSGGGGGSISVDSVDTILASAGRARAGGGPISSGHAYLVGENGPEVFMPNRSGTVIPKAANVNIPRGMGSSNVTQTFHITVDARDAVLQSQVQRQIIEAMGLAADAGGDIGIQRNGRRQRRVMP